MPPIEGLDSVRAWNNREATTSKRVPASMIVLGGGPVGSRARPGLVDAGHRGHPGRGRRAAALPREEPFAGEQVADAAARGARRRRPHRRPGRAGRAPAATGVEVELDDGERGRGGRAPRRGRPQAPHRRRSGSTSVGVEPGEGGFLETDDRLRVGGRDWLYAVGDVNGRALFTHMGKYQAWVAAENVLGREVEAIAEGIGSPRVTFTDPQVAAVGKTLEQARGGGHRRPGGRRRRPTAPPAPASRARGPAAPPGSSSTRPAGRSSAPPSPASRPPTSSTRATIAIVGEVPLTRLRHAVAAYPDPQRDLAEAAREAYGL